MKKIVFQLFYKIMSSVITRPVDDVIEYLEDLCRQFMSSYGPKGKLKAFENGGDVTIGNSSTHLFSCLRHQLRHQQSSIIDLLQTSIKDHLKIFSDFGKFIFLFSSHLVISASKNNLSNSEWAKCFRFLLNESCYVINNCCDDADDVMVSSCKLEFSYLCKFVSGILRSRPILQEDKIDKLKFLLISAFISEFENGQNKKWPTIYYQPNLSISESRIFHKFLIRLYHHDDDIYDQLPIRNARVILYDVMMTWQHFRDKYAANDDATHLQKSFEILFDEVIDALTSHHVTLLINIKVVDDVIKRRLKTRGIICIDRVGISHVANLRQVTGCRVNYDVSNFFDDVIIGFVEECECIKVGSGKFVSLISGKSPVLTSLVVCFQNSCFHDDIKQACEAVMTSLTNIFNSRKVLIGAGKFELLLATKLEEHFRSDDVISRLPCRVTQFQICLSAFLRVLRLLGKQLASDDVITDDVFDCYEAKMNAFQIAIQMAALILDIRFQIIDPS